MCTRRKSSAWYTHGASAPEPPPPLQVTPSSPQVNPDIVGFSANQAVFHYLVWDEVRIMLVLSKPDMVPQVNGPHSRNTQTWLGLGGGWYGSSVSVVPPPPPTL